MVKKLKYAMEPDVIVLARPARFERAAFRLGVWHTSLYTMWPGDFQC